MHNINFNEAGGFWRRHYNHNKESFFIRCLFLFKNSVILLTRTSAVYAKFRII